MNHIQMFSKNFFFYTEFVHYADIVREENEKRRKSLNKKGQELSQKIESKKRTNKGHKRESKPFTDIVWAFLKRLEKCFNS